ncbi:hypothetical protein BH10BAC5_BH10BAC5_24710 [soil metagenome]
MIFESDKLMFEIYRQKDFNKKFKLLIYTELNEHNKEAEINRALDGETVYDGFIKDNVKVEAKKVLAKMIDEMNQRNAAFNEDEISEKLKPFLA